jgi:predicted MFS family arabinose efflux permease
MALAGSSAMGIVVPGLSLWVSSNLGWKAVYLLLASYPLFVVWPVAWLVIRRRTSQPAYSQQEVSGPQPASYGAILRRGHFYLLAIAIFGNALAAGALMLHFVPMLGRFGLAPGTAGLLAGLFGPAAFGARLAVGALLASRLPVALVYIGCVLLAVPAAWLLVLAPGEALVAAAGVVLAGLAQGVALVFVSYFASRQFELAEFGRVASLLTGAYAIGFGVGPVIAGAVFDRFHSYHWVALGVIAIAVATTVPAWLVGARADALRSAEGPTA